MNHARRKTGILCMVLGLICICCALGLLAYNERESQGAGEASAATLAELKDASASSTDAALDLDGSLYIGYLTIPALDLQLPVMDTWDYQKLTQAPCRYYGSVETNDLVICAHNYTEHFGRLKELVPGDEVAFTGTDGQTTVYKVAALETLQPTEIARMIQSDYDLTLYTCTFGGASRVTVRCECA